MSINYSRRKWLCRAGAGFGAVAASSLLPAGPLSAKAPHQPARAKAVIHLFMHGGVSHVDTWDPKPELTRLSGETLPGSFAKGLKTSRIDFSKAIMRGSPWGFKRHGQGGTEVSELFPNIARHADEFVLVRSCRGDAFDHAPAMFLLSTGSQVPGRPCLGSWTVYGLGSENENLPAFVVMSDGAMKCGPQGYAAGYLPAVYQGTLFRSGKTPIMDLSTPQGVSDASQRATLDFINKMDRRHAEARSGDSELEARLQSYELAYRMQSAAPEAVDLGKESAATRKLYGIGEPATDDFGRKCLLARRLVERGVRFVTVYSGGGPLVTQWDAHDNVNTNHEKMCGHVDKPIAALLKDLKQRDMLKDTLVVWCSEFGRTPNSQGGKGRDHNPLGYTMWLAGGGATGGAVVGTTDEFGLKTVDDPVSVNDFHATILHLLGLDHEKLTYRHSGRDERLTDVGGVVVEKALA